MALQRRIGPAAKAAAGPVRPLVGRTITRGVASSSVGVLCLSRQPSPVMAPRVYEAQLMRVAPHRPCLTGETVPPLTSTAPQCFGITIVHARS